ncbi:hypothetical protein T03_7563 [Trichinella britovi]|uniref:Uncharacterized protein n=1 Tax=Trichinella britovi TaxID=45882 RepID=A0A0V1CBW5_TRIBR|nr:hypothetical protein T03_7563 [Trichinella britovi]
MQASISQREPQKRKVLYVLLKISSHIITCIISSCVTITLLFIQDPSVAAAMKLRNEQPSSLTVDSKCNFVFLSMIFTCIKWHKFFAHPDKHNKEHMDIEDYSRRMLLCQKCTEIVPAIRLINRLQFPGLVTACRSCCRRHWLQLPKKCSALTATTDINHPY